MFPAGWTVNHKDSEQAQGGTGRRHTSQLTGNCCTCGGMTGQCDGCSACIDFGCPGYREWCDVCGFSHAVEPRPCEA